MTAYTPSFLFDFTIFYAFSGLDNTQLLFIGMVIIFTNLYLHISLSKKHLLYSFPFTLFLLGGMGLRVATSPISLTYFFHYIFFLLLLMILVIDHKLFLLIPENYQTPLGKTKTQIERISLPAFNTVHPKPSRKSGFSAGMNFLSQSVQQLKQTITSKLGTGSPQPTVSSSKTNQQSFKPSSVSKDLTSDEQQYVHPFELDAGNVKTTKQLLSAIETKRLDSLDSRINKTKLEDQSFLDSFFKEPSLPSESTADLEHMDISSIMHNIDASAAIISRGVVKAVNEQFASLLQRPIADIVNKDFIQFLAPEGLPSFKQHCSKRLSREASSSFRLVLLSKQHEKIPLQVTIKPMILHGEPVEITVFQRINT